MLSSTLFIALWVLLGLGVFFVAIRGGLGGAREPLHAQSRGARRVAALFFAVVYVGFGVVLPAVFLVGNRDKASGQVGGIRLTGEQKAGRELFGAHCAVCHELAAANAVGKVGPNLDVLRPAESLVAHTITYGCLQNPPSPSSPQTCLGFGNMPAEILAGRDEQDVASFVAAVAGRE